MDEEPERITGFAGADPSKESTGSEPSSGTVAPSSEPRSSEPPKPSETGSSEIRTNERQSSGSPQPGSTQPGSSQSETSPQPGSSEPETSNNGSSQSRKSQSGTSQSETSPQPGSYEPETSIHGSSQSGTSQSGSSQPGSSKSGLSEPKPSQPNGPNTESRPAEEQGAASRVNGIGLWNSWTRNFRNPFMAFMDLMDNAMDATMTPPNPSDSDTPFAGQIECFISDPRPASPNNSTATTPATGSADICVRNNCLKPIQPLVQVLEVFKSTKTQSCVGENGVGVKQACAALSDLSIILTRNAEIHKYSIGILNRGLQREEGCFLPSYFFELGKNNEKQELDSLFKDCRKNEKAITLLFAKNLDQLIETQGALRQSLIVYGNLGAGVGKDPKDALKLGRKKLIRHLCQLSGWTKNDTHTFYTILTDIKDAQALLDEIKGEMPQYYIHVPKSLDVIICDQKIKFQFWERRLADITQFDTRIDTKNSVFNVDSQDWDWPDNGYDLRLFIGFDPIRASHDMAQLSMYIYSRRSGRLIRREEDGRRMLGLGNSGTKYGQGMTVIIDDFENNLQLTPTKQDISFATEAYGDVHRQNLFAWIGGYCDMYYQWYEDYYIKKKTISERVARLSSDVEHLAHQDLPHTLADGEFNAFEDVKFMRTQIKNIRCYRRKIIKRIVGKDTILRVIQKTGIRDWSDLLTPRLMSAPKQSSLEETVNFNDDKAAGSGDDAANDAAGSGDDDGDAGGDGAGAGDNGAGDDDDDTGDDNDEDYEDNIKTPRLRKRRASRSKTPSTTTASATKRGPGRPRKKRKKAQEHNDKIETLMDDSALKDEALKEKDFQIRKLQQRVDILREEKKQSDNSAGVQRRGSRRNQSDGDMGKIREENRRFQEQISSLDTEVARLKHELEEANERDSRHSDEVTELRATVAQLKQKLEKANKSDGNNDGEMAKLRAEVARLKSFNDILGEENKSQEMTIEGNQRTIKKLKNDLKQLL